MNIDSFNEVKTAARNMVNKALIDLVVPLLGLPTSELSLTNGTNALAEFWYQHYMIAVRVDITRITFSLTNTDTHQTTEYHVSEYTENPVKRFQDSLATIASERIDRSVMEVTIVYRGGSRTETVKRDSIHCAECADNGNDKDSFTVYQWDNGTETALCGYCISRSR